MGAPVAHSNGIEYGWRGVDYTALHTGVSAGHGAPHPSDPWSIGTPLARFVDLSTGGPAPLATSARVSWDEVNLYVAFDAEEPSVSATMTRDGELLFFENDLELFIDGGDSYYELEFNAAGTKYEVFYVWRDAAGPGSVWDTPRFDVHAPTAHSFAGDHERTATSFWYGNHPRGTRWAFLDYRIQGLELSVDINGEINNPAVIDTGWTARITIPWSSLSDLANGRSLPPQDGDTWRMFFGRFEQLATRQPGVNIGLGWAANAHGVNDTHIPESWTNVTFSVGSA